MTLWCKYLPSDMWLKLSSCSSNTLGRFVFIIRYMHAHISLESNWVTEHTKYCKHGYESLLKCCVCSRCSLSLSNACNIVLCLWKLKHILFGSIRTWILSLSLYVCGETNSVPHTIILMFPPTKSWNTWMTSCFDLVFLKSVRHVPSHFWKRKAILEWDYYTLDGHWRRPLT